MGYNLKGVGEGGDRGREGGGGCGRGMAGGVVGRGEGGGMGIGSGRKVLGWGRGGGVGRLGGGDGRANQQLWGVHGVWSGITFVVPSCDIAVSLGNGGECWRGRRWVGTVGRPVRGAIP